MSYYRCFCIRPRAVQTHVCLFPCEGSHLEPLCIHTYAHKYTYIMSQIRLYINPCCALSHLFVPLRVLTLRASLYTCIHSQIYIFHITDAFVYDPVYMHIQMIYIISIHFFTAQILLYMNPCCAASHMSVPLRVLTLRTF